jgi:hypothetical protein
MKIFIRLFFAVLICLFLSVSTVYSFLPNIIAHKIQKLALVDTSIRSIGLSFNKIEVSKFQMDNLPNSILPIALKIDDITLKNSLSNYFENEITIERVNCENFTIGLEFDSKASSQGNWTKIINNFDSASELSSKSSESITINKLLVKNVTILLVYRDNPNQIKTLNIDQIELNNLSSSGEFPTGQITKIILRETLKQIFSLENLGNMMKDLLTPRQWAPYTNPLKSFFSHAESTSAAEDF